MCVYCSVGDSWFKYDPPWNPRKDDSPLIPKPFSPSAPINPWSIEKLKEYYDLLLKIKELEEKIGCPCEPNKADYVGILKNRIEELERKEQPK